MAGSQKLTAALGTAGAGRQQSVGKTAHQAGRAASHDSRAQEGGAAMLAAPLNSRTGYLATAGSGCSRAQQHGGAVLAGLLGTRQQQNSLGMFHGTWQLPIPGPGHMP